MNTALIALAANAIINENGWGSREYEVLGTILDNSAKLTANLGTFTAGEPYPTSLVELNANKSTISNLVEYGYAEVKGGWIRPTKELMTIALHLILYKYE